MIALPLSVVLDFFGRSGRPDLRDLDAQLPPPPIPRLTVWQGMWRVLTGWLSARSD